ERRARAALEAAFADEAQLSEPSVARALAAALPREALLFVSSSMPVRDLDAWASAGEARVLANRGVNGVDGIVSSVLGAAAATGQPAAALLGDLALLHDLSGLLAARRLGIPLLAVVVNNDGGGIFNFLPVAELSDWFEPLFATPHGLDLSHLAAFCGATLQRPSSAAGLRACVREGLGSGLPGQGRSPPATGWDAALDELGEGLGPGPFHLAGYSMGARLALAFAMRFPERVRSLALESGSPGLADLAERTRRQSEDRMWE